jgi:predicted NUDIX family NTP pyrophosphohydrolase
VGRRQYEVAYRPSRNAHRRRGIHVCHRCRYPRGPPLIGTGHRQTGGKIVTAFAVNADLDIGGARSNTFELERPRGSGRIREYSEVDRVAWVPVATARVKLLKGQVPLLDVLMGHPDVAGLREA